MSGIREYKSVEKWLNNVKPSTSEPYLHFLRRFCEYTKLNPDQLLENAKSGPEEIHDTLKAFRRQLEGQGLASYTLQLAYNAVRSFLTWNSVRLSKSPRAFAGHTRYESDRVLETHEVARMISFAQSTRDKALVSILCHGQRVGVLPALRYGMIREQLEKNVNPIVIAVRGELIDANGVNVNKESVPYRFAIVKETVALIRQMMQERRDAGEPINDDSWLFRSYSIKFKGKLLRFPRDKPGPAMSRDWISNMVQKVAEKAGIQVKRSIGKAVSGKEKVKYDVHSHVFRRFWKRQLKRSGITDSELLDFMMGHKATYGGAYDKFDADYIRKEYAKAEPFLTVMINPEIQVLQDIEQLRGELKAKGIDADAEFSKHPSWTGQDKKGWMQLMARQTKTLKTSKSEPKQKVELIDESQATNHLNHGYKLLAVMPSGKLLVEYVGE